MIPTQGQRRVGRFLRGALARTVSAQQYSSSHLLLKALEEGGVEDVRNALLNTPDGLKRSTLLNASYDAKHAFRTPLMAAARTGNYAVYATVMNAIERLFVRGRGRRGEAIRRQLLETDKDGRTIAMHAALGGNVIILVDAIREIRATEAFEALTAKDHIQMTLLMHATAMGQAAGFQTVFDALEDILMEEQLIEHMILRSGHDQTLLMIAAGSGNKMAFKACVESVQLTISPHEFRMLMRARDAEGMTFLMHAGNPHGDRYNSINVFGGGGAGAGRALPLQASSSRPALPQRPRERAETFRRPFVHPASTAPATLGPGGSEEVLRRHSRQRPVALSDQKGETEATDFDDTGTSTADDESKGGESSPLLYAPTPDQADRRGEGLDSRATSRAQEITADGREDDTVRLTFWQDDNMQRQRQGQQQGQEPHNRQVFGAGGIAMHPRVPVLKAAVALNRKCLWKEQVRNMLTTKDSWDRSLIQHGILSGSPQVFEVAFAAVRADVLDEEVEELMDSGDNFENSKPLVMARTSGGRRMENTVQHRISNLRRDVEMRAKASTFEAKIQSFIPGKLIILFQLLLPEIPSSSYGLKRLTLLLVMSALAPIIAWASGLVQRRATVHNPGDFVIRRSSYSYVLSALAMFVWGVGTSNIFEDGFDWPESRGAAVLAVGTIVIPALDGFVNSQRVEQWNDKFSFSRWRFSRQAEVTWHKARATAMKKKVTIARQHAFPRAATSASTTAAPAASVPELDRGKRLGELDDDAGDDADAGDEIVVNASRSPHVKTDPGRQTGEEQKEVSEV